MPPRVDLLPAWQNVVKAIVEDRRWTYGDLIPDRDIEDLLGLSSPGAAGTAAEYETFKLRWVAETTRLHERLLIDHDMLLDRVHGLGWRIVLPSEQIRLVEARARKERAKVARRHRAGLVHTNTDLLTAEERKERTDAIVRQQAREDALRSVDRGKFLTFVPKRVKGPDK